MGNSEQASGRAATLNYAPPVQTNPTDLV